MRLPNRPTISKHSLLHGVRGAQEYAAIVAEIFLLLAFAISGMDVAIGGTLSHIAWIAYAWGAIFALGLDTAFILSVVRLGKLGKSWHQAWAIPLAVGLAFIVFEPVAIQQLQQALLITFEDALTRLGINLPFLVFARSGVAVFLAAILALTNTEKKAPAQAALPPHVGKRSIKQEPQEKPPVGQPALPAAPSLDMIEQRMYTALMQDPQEVQALLQVAQEKSVEELATFLQQKYARYAHYITPERVQHILAFARRQVPPTKTGRQWVQDVERAKAGRLAILANPAISQREIMAITGIRSTSTAGKFKAEILAAAAEGGFA